MKNGSLGCLYKYMQMMCSANELLLMRATVVVKLMLKLWLADYLNFVPSQTE